MVEIFGKVIKARRQETDSSSRTDILQLFIDHICKDVFYRNGLSLNSCLSQ
jgi:hypothetical protein